MITLKTAFSNQTLYEYYILLFRVKTTVVVSDIKVHKFQNSYGISFLGVHMGFQEVRNCWKAFRTWLLLFCENVI